MAYYVSISLVPLPAAFTPLSVFRHPSHERGRPCRNAKRVKDLPGDPLLNATPFGLWGFGRQADGDWLYQIMLVILRCYCVSVIHRVSWRDMLGGRTRPSEDLTFCARLVAGADGGEYQD